ncbi:hypothetical protein [Adhaeribacter soli]|uniref:DUF4840 domain-containing protein n=1 Tax=Adhaeribacter soli TaxID=2607655 RepID=A0A5N1J0P6_9BACT|nr:hypothetical protein [Adhaeribacter soli]KAA9340275.1 hypothetical protein F0P94_07980 [Adhaeribacter soli]
MRKLSVVLLLAAALFTSCKKEVETVEKLFTFEMRNEQHFVASKKEVNKAYANGSAWGLTEAEYPIAIASDSEAEFKRNNTTTHLVKNIRVQELKMAMPGNLSATFNFLKDIEVYVADSLNRNPVLMAYARDIQPDGKKTLILTPTENVMDKYVKTGNYSLRIKGKMVDTVSSDLNIKVNMVFKVTASPLN